MSAGAGNLADLYLAASGGSALSGLGNSYVQSQALRQQGAYARQTGEENALMAELQMKDVKRAGERGAAMQGLSTKDKIARQMVAAASSGVDPGSANLADITGDTAAFGALETEAMTNDRWRQAWGLRSEASQSRRAGRAARQGANFDARMTAATGGLQFGRDLLSGAYGYEQFRKDKKKD